MQQKFKWDFPPAIPQTLEYTQLADPTNQTRIIHIAPAAFDQEISCSLEVINLAQDVVSEYHALSYVWGSTEQELRSILVDGSSFTVTYNQEHALRHLREAGVTKLWIDAISIDQSNATERVAQMIVMHTIYAKAHQVDIWLGKYDKIRSLLESFDETIQQLEYYLVPFWEKILIFEDGSHYSPKLTLPVAQGTQDVLESTIRCAEHICALPLWKLSGNKMKAGDLPFYVVHRSDTTPSKLHLRLRKDWFRACYLLHWIFESEWWSRVWVVQEAASSQQDPMMWIGKHPFSFTKIMDTARAVLNHGSSAFDKELSIRIFAELTYVTWEEKNLISTMAAMVRSVHGDSPDGILIHNTSRARATTDPRDHVFGVLGLIDHKLVELLKKNTETTIDQFAKHIASFDVRNAFALGSHMLHDLQAPRNKLTSLTFAVGVSPGRRSLHNLCSWSLDWSCKRQYMMDLPGTAPFDTCRDTQATSEYCQLMSQTHFVISACPVGVVDRVALSLVANPDTDDETDELSIKTIKLWRNFIGSYAKQTKERGSRSVTDSIFWKTVMADDTSSLAELPSNERCERLSEDNIQQLNRDWHTLTTSQAAYKLSKLQTHPRERMDNHERLSALGLMMQLAVDDKSVFHFKPFRPSLFTRRNFFVGRGRHDIRPGDVVCVMKGCFAPVILRVPPPSLSLHSHLLPEYEFVSLAYVDGIMDGEAVDDGTFWQKLCLV